MWHIIDRYVYHFGWALVLVGAFAYALSYWIGRNAKVGSWVSGKFQHLLVLSAFIVGTIMPAREAYDIILGNQVWYKTPFDQMSWYTGAAVGVWAWYRISKRIKRLA